MIKNSFILTLFLCFAFILQSNDAYGGYSFTPLLIQDNGFTIKFERNRYSTEEDYAHVQLIYMRNMADIGLQLHPKKKKRPE